MKEGTEIQGSDPSGFKNKLSNSGSGILSIYAIFAAFTTYFCMYAFRKPFAATDYGGLKFLGSDYDLKTAYVIAQLIGYTISKYVGMKVCSEAGKSGRAKLLVTLILTAWASLLLFAILPGELKVIAIFANGLPLGMVWGTVVLHLEGRRTSEFMLAGLSCSYIIASGVVKDIGRWLISDYGVSDYWMPFATAAIFLLPFLVGVYLLSQLPLPTQEDKEERCARTQMHAKDRWAFLREFAVGMVILASMYFFLTAYRDYRDNYGIEILQELGLGDQAGIFSKTEIPIAFGVLLALSLLCLIRSNRVSLIFAFILMTSGQILMGVSTWMLQNDMLDGIQWWALIGLGAYLTYVPFGTVLFDRLLAYTRFAGTAVFAIYLTDAIGYTGSIGLQIYKDQFLTDTSRLEFFQHFTYAMSIGGSISLLASLAYFMRRGSRQTQDA